MDQPRSARCRDPSQLLTGDGSRHSGLVITQQALNAVRQEDEIRLTYKSDLAFDASIVLIRDTDSWRVVTDFAWIGGLICPSLQQ